jgi:hypothetical protein
MAAIARILVGAMCLALATTVADARPRPHPTNPCSRRVCVIWAAANKTCLKYRMVFYQSARCARTKMLRHRR